MKINGVLAVFLVGVITAGCSVMPEPIPREQIADMAKMDINLIYQSQEPLEGGLTLHKAMARALKYNLDNRVKLMEQALANKSFDLAKMDMLPILAFSAGYMDRDNVHGSWSQSILTKRQSLEPSTSQDQIRRTNDIRFAWNILDFGVSYLQAKQDADRYLISKRTRQDVMLKLLEQVRGTFWRAAIMQQLTPEVEIIMAQVKSTLADLQQVHREKLRPPLSTLNDMRILIEILQQLEDMQDKINASQIELATLINLPPGSNASLVLPQPQDADNDLPVIKHPVKELELLALVNSADYASQVYNVRIDQLESRKSLMRLLPGLEFYYTDNYDSNSFLYNATWGELGMRLTGDIMQMLTYGHVKAQGEARENLATARRLAVNMAVVAQVHLAWQEHSNSQRRLKRARGLDKVDQEISRITANAHKTQAESGVRKIQNDLRAFRSKMGRLLAYADTEERFGALLQTLGLNPVPEDYQLLDVNDLSGHLSANFDQWRKGDIELPSALPVLSLAPCETCAGR